MSLALFFAVLNLGMGTQAAISAALFPDGIDPNQQMRAAFLFAILGLLFFVLDIVLDRHDRR